MNFKVFLAIIGLLVASFGYGQITINSLTPTTSDCPNNGTVTVNATHSGGSSMLYSIISGPMIVPKQSSNVFSSLELGSYIVEVSDLFNNKTTQSVSVSGTYDDINFNPKTTIPSCPGLTDGSLMGNINSFTGKAPYTWELIAPSEVLASPQASDLFENLPPGEYTVRATDDCGAFDTRIVNIKENNEPIDTYGEAIINMIDCNTAEVGIRIESPQYSPPYNVTIKSGGSTITVPIPQTAENDSLNGIIDVYQEMPGIGYGDNITVTIEDKCGRSTSTAGSIPDFSMCAETEIKTKTEDCSQIIETTFKSSCGSFSDLLTNMATPVTYELRNNTTNAVVESGTINDGEDASQIVISEVPPGENYTFTATDACGNTSGINYIAPSDPNTGGGGSGTPELAGPIQFRPSFCTDSSTFVKIFVRDFSTAPTLIIESGPAQSINTQKNFEYNNTFTYPKTYSLYGGTASYGYFYINNMPAGNYTYKVVDDCNNELQGDFEITQNDVSNIGYSIYQKPNCTGKNQLHYDITYSFKGTAELYNYGGYSESKFHQPTTNNVIDSIVNVPPGDFIFRYSPYHYLAEDFRETGNDDCYFIREEIEILDYESPKIYTYNKIICNGDIFVELIPDSTKGTPPYEYEIISGPETFPRQTSNSFAINTEGVYRARIYDECGNASVVDVSLTNIEFEPLSADVSCSNAQIVYPSSIYYSYNWTRPNNSTFSGDSLILNNITFADTGTYTVKQLVNINGCTETFTDTYHLLAQSNVELYDTICPGNTYSFGSKLYTSSGIYTDTIPTSTGCDSIVAMNLYVKDYLTGSTSATICPGSDILIEGNFYNEVGSYKDTLSTFGCDSILTINIAFSNYLKGTYSEEICKDGSTIIEGKTYDSPGIFKDTISNGTCDSIIEITITEIDYLRESIPIELCAGSDTVINSKIYSLAGSYPDTILTADCDSIITYNIIVKPLPIVDLGSDIELCQGNKALFKAENGYTKYTWNDNTAITSNKTFQTDAVGKYWLSVTDNYGCVGSDTVKITQINPVPTVNASSTSPICEGDSIVLSATGGIKYLWLPDSLYGQQITVAPEKTSNYYVTAYNNYNCASLTKTVSVKVNHLPTVPIFDQEKIIHCFLENELILSANWGESFLWSNTGDTTQSITVSDEGYYDVTVWDKNGCLLSKEIEVLNKCESLIFVPDAFSPNYDGNNDELQVFGKNFTDFEMRIFNRWGEVIFMTDDRNQMWDGIYKGKMMPVGSYPWVIKYKSIPGTLDEGTLKQITGSITVIR